MLKTIKITAVSKNYSTLSKWLNEAIELWSLDDNLANKMNICLEEIFINIASYAYDKNTGDTEISIDKIDNEITIKFEDEGIEYNPLQKEDPDTTLSLDERPIGGLGIFMVKQMAKNVEYERCNNKNVLKLTFEAEQQT